MTQKIASRIACSNVFAFPSLFCHNLHTRQRFYDRIRFSFSENGKYTTHEKRPRDGWVGIWKWCSGGSDSASVSRHGLRLWQCRQNVQKPSFHSSASRARRGRTMKNAIRLVEEVRVEWKVIVNAKQEFPVSDILPLRFLEIWQPANGFVSVDCMFAEN